MIQTKPLITGMELEELSNLAPQSNCEYFHHLSQFMNSRSELLNLILSAPKLTIKKQAMHTIFGPTSFSEIVEFIAIHDLKHIHYCTELLQNG